MPYEEDKTTIPTSSTIPKSRREILQKNFTNSQVADMSSELSKANRQLRSGVYNQAQYKEAREKIFAKYDITKAERIRFLGAKFAS